MKLPKEHIVRPEKSTDHITANAAAAKIRGEVQAALRKLEKRLPAEAIKVRDGAPKAQPIYRPSWIAGAQFVITYIRNLEYSNPERANKRLGGLGRK